MPLVIVTSPGPPAPPPPPPTPEIPHLRPQDPGTYQALWYPPDGSEPIDLNPRGENWWSLKMISGLGVVPVDVITSESPYGGVKVDDVRERERVIQWPIRIRGTTHMEFVETWRFLSYKITQTRFLGPGKLVIRRPDGSRREIQAYHSSGLEGEPEEGMWLRATETITFLCPDGYWRDPTPVVLEFREEPMPNYLDPYPTLASGRQLGSVTVTNPGDRPVWPQWRIRGPLTSLTARNETRGEEFQFVAPLAKGEEATISGLPIQVRGPNGENWINALGLLSGRGKPWRLDPRTTSTIQFTATGAQADSEPGADDGTRLWLSWHVDYLSP